MISPDHLIQQWVEDWCLFVEEAIEINLDGEQKQILRSVQVNPMTTVTSGTARGKDFVAAIAAICFLYLVPAEDAGGNLESTKVALTAPTDRQVKNIMMPEIATIYNKLRQNGICPNDARLMAYDIRTNNENIFLTGFRADENQHEAWSGFHAVNTMFIVTEASGITESIFAAIEGNLQGNSRLLLVFNNNSGTGYAANSLRSSRFKKFRLDSLTAPNVLQKRIVIPGQVNYEWVEDKVRTWCTRIEPGEFKAEEGDFEFDIDGERNCYRPNDTFRVKVRGMAPKVSSDVLVPAFWIDIANEKWKDLQKDTANLKYSLRLGVDVAGMGNDSTCFCHRYKNYVDRFEMIHSDGKAKHMELTGRILNYLKSNTYSQAFIDTIGEGAGVFSRLIEIAQTRKEIDEQAVFSVKFSHAPAIDDKPLSDLTGEYKFLNMRAYLYWAIRDWLNPANKTGAALPFDEELSQELSETKWEILSNGSIKIEEKKNIKSRIGRSPDKADALANTFYPVKDYAELQKLKEERRKNFERISKMFYH